jgi:Outer membrane protein beta-barrel domain
MKWITILTVSLLINSFSFAASTESDSEVVKKISNKEIREMEERNKINPYAKKFGAHIGLSFANSSLGSSVSTDSSSRMGLMAGVIMEVPLLPGFMYMQPELNFVQKGAINSVFGREISVRTNYIELPLIAKIKLSTPSFKPEFFAGPSFGYLVSSSFDPVLVPAPEFNSFELGLNLGIGFSLPISDVASASEIQVLARYTKALNDTFAKVPWKSESFLIQVGFIF